jgi:predicted nucleic acid-binding protein
LILADTTFLIDLIDGDSGAENLARLLDNDTVGISSISIHEYLFGIYYKFSENKQLLRQKLLSAQSAFSAFEILPFNRKIAGTSSMIHATLVKEGNPIGINDIYIAATAVNYRLRLITRNIRHFKSIKNLEIQEY